MNPLNLKPAVVGSFPGDIESFVLRGAGGAAKFPDAFGSSASSGGPGEQL